MALWTPPFNYPLGTLLYHHQLTHMYVHLYTYTPAHSLPPPLSPIPENATAIHPVSQGKIFGGILDSSLLSPQLINRCIPNPFQPDLLNSSLHFNTSPLPFLLTAATRPRSFHTASHLNSCCTHIRSHFHTQPRGHQDVELIVAASEKNFHFLPPGLAFPFPKTGLGIFSHAQFLPNSIITIYLSIPPPPSWLPRWLSGKESTCNAGGTSLIPGSRRSPGEGTSNPLQYSCLGNPMDRGAWRATVHGVTKSWT